MSHTPSCEQLKSANMEPIKFTLCQEFDFCPKVEITDQGLSIGKDENTVRLSHAEWNELVRLVRSGVLTIPGLPSGAGQ